MTQASAADEADDIVVPEGDAADDVADDAAPGGFWLPHAIKTSPHAAATKTPRVTVRPRTAALVRPQ